MKDYEKLLNTGLKEIDVITGTFECALIDQMNISNIEDMYMVESVGDGVDKVKEFFKKMIEAFKNTLKKIKDRGAFAPHPDNPLKNVDGNFYQNAIILRFSGRTICRF